jgi:hypothetical protein
MYPKQGRSSENETVTQQPTDGSEQIDSRPATRAHIARVQTFLVEVIGRLADRAREHDQSKLVEPELSGFDQYTAQLSSLRYGSPEYAQSLQGLQSTLDHHYAHNDHHPQHHEGGIHDMDLLQLLEMLADWRAATERTTGGSLRESIRLNAERFGYDEAFQALLTRTAENLGWLESEETGNRKSQATVGEAVAFDSSDAPTEQRDNV